MWKFCVVGYRRATTAVLGGAVAGRTRDASLMTSSASDGLRRLSTRRSSPPLGKKVALTKEEDREDVSPARKARKKKVKGPIVRGGVVDTVVGSRRGRRRVTSGVAIRQMGLARRVFVRRPHCTPAEMQELADRLFILGRNESINSILIVNDGGEWQKPGECLPRSLLEMVGDATDLAMSRAAGNPTALLFKRAMSDLEQASRADEDDNRALVSNGLDPRFLYESGLHSDPEAIRTVLSSISSLSLAARGGIERDEHDSEVVVGESKVPVVTIPDGLVTDGGYALCMGSYVLATDSSRFQILNPTRGLSLDPTGASFLLPRLGQEFRQLSAMRYSLAAAVVLALGGFAADALDMVETGLATHYLESSSKIALVEEALSELRPYNLQGIFQSSTRLHVNPYDEVSLTKNVEPPAPTTNTSTKDDYEQFEFDGDVDVNDHFRNRALANVLGCCSLFGAFSHEFPRRRETDAFWQDFSDPSLVGMARTQASSALFARDSELLEVAALLNDVVRQEATLVGLAEGLAGMANKQKNEQSSEKQPSSANLDEREVAAALLKKMNEASPLALHATFQLLQLGCRDFETLETCMARELHVLTKLYQKEDYRRWAAAEKEGGRSPQWTHASIQDVTADEVEELFEGQVESLAS